MINILRPSYIDHITEHLNRDMMIILVGQRRVGKSFILLQLRDWLENNIADANIVYINKEEKRYRDIVNDDDLYDYVDQKLLKDSNNYLLIDEVQDIKDYENALRSLYAERRCQIVATGSNAYLFSSEIHTRLSGRYIEIPVYSLTYREFLQFHKLEDSDENLNKFLRVGGLPGLINYDIENRQTVSDYINGVYRTVLTKDIISREGIRNVSFMENLIEYIADNVGKPISPANISKVMEAQQIKISEPVVSSYLKYIVNSLLANQVFKYDLHGKKILVQQSKYYYSDHGIRNYLCDYNIRQSIEKIIENVVYHHLLTQGFKIYVGDLHKTEIDFVAQKGDKRIYVQAAYMIATPETEEREFGNLLKIKDNYPKYVVSMDPWTGGANSYEGIHHLSLRDFLKTVF